MATHCGSGESSERHCPNEAGLLRAKARPSYASPLREPSMTRISASRGRREWKPRPCAGNGGQGATASLASAATVAI